MNGHKAQPKLLAVVGAMVLGQVRLGGASFTDVTSTAGVGDTSNSLATAWADYGATVTCVFLLWSSHHLWNHRGRRKTPHPSSRPPYPGGSAKRRATHQKQTPPSRPTHLDTSTANPKQQPGAPPAHGTHHPSPRSIHSHLCRYSWLALSVGGLSAALRL